jgi:hypothetical protein
VSGADCQLPIRERWLTSQLSLVAITFLRVFPQHSRREMGQYTLAMV